MRWLVVGLALQLVAGCSSGRAPDLASELDGMSFEGGAPDIQPDGRFDAGAELEVAVADPDSAPLPADTADLDWSSQAEPDGADAETAADAADSSDAPGVAPFEIEFAAPSDGATVTGSVALEIVPVGVDELLLDELQVTIEGQVVFRDTKAPTSFVLDSRDWDVAVLHLAVTAQAGGHSAQNEVTIGVDNPEFRFQQVYANLSEVANGSAIEIILNASQAGLDVEADFSALDSEFASGAETIQEIGIGKYKVLYTISEDNGRPDGTYVIPVSVFDGESKETYPHLVVALANIPRPPLRVQGGIYVPGEMPDSDSGWELPDPDTGGNEFIITGGSAKVQLDFTDFPYPAEIVGVLVGTVGFAGYYQVPLELSTGEEEILLLLSAYLEGEEPPESLSLQLALRDVAGRYSPVVTRDMAVETVGSGDVQVSISWDTATDVDLHVIEAGGFELWYGDQQSPSGGELDLDSNPGCVIDGINNENVYWPAGMAPVGTYTVRVDFYSDCTNCLFGYCGADYTVTINYCGENELFYGSFAPGADDSGGAGSGVEVASFSNESCGQVLRGRIRYADRTFDETGFGAGTWKPARYVVVEAYAKQNNELLATGTTDRQGNYEIQFFNPGEPGVYIVVYSKTDFDEGLHPIAVMNHPKFKAVYAVSSLSVDESQTDVSEINFDVPEIVGSGAFNILDVLVEGYDGIRLHTGKELGELQVFWATGTDTTDTLFCSGFLYGQGLCSEPGAVSVQGKDTDRDEFDDMVILKEFFRFALEQVSIDDSPGGPVDGTRDDPRRAWNEGVSTFLAGDALGLSDFVNSRPAGVYIVEHLETQASPFSFQTSSGAMDGPVSPFLVAALLHDLADDAGGESFDAIDGGAVAIYDAIFNYLPSSHLVDRGVVGVDLVDFLDGWLCRGWNSMESLQELVVDHRQFPYDFEGPESCLH